MPNFIPHSKIVGGIQITNAHHLKGPSTTSGSGIVHNLRVPHIFIRHGGRIQLMPYRGEPAMVKVKVGEGRSKRGKSRRGKSDNPLTAIIRAL